MFFDAKEYHSSNQNVANILSNSAPETAKVQEVEETEIAGVEDAWGDEIDGIDIDMGEDPMMPNAGDPLLDDHLESDIFVPPSAGADPLQQALKKNPSSVGLHIASGEFTKALELLKKQLGINTYASLK